MNGMGGSLRSIAANGKELASAIFTILLGIAVVTAGVHYRVGSLTHMGPGYIPVVLGVLLMGVGVLIGLARPPARTDAAREPAKGPWRGWVCILASVFAFVLVGAHAGLVPASFATVFIAALGDRKNSPRDALLLALAIAAVSYLIFIVALSLQFPAFDWR